MKKSTKILLGAGTLWPFVYIFIFILFFFTTALIAPGREEGTAVFGAMMVVILAMHLFTMALSMGLTIFYIVNVFRNPRVDQDKKVLWAVVIFFANLFAMPVYWYLYIWKEPAVAGPGFPGQLNSMDSSAWTNDARSSRQREEQYVPPSQPPDWR